MAERQKQNTDWGSWVFIIFMLWVFWPVGLFLLFSKLFGNDRKKNTAKAGAAPAPERSNRARAAVGSVTKSPVAKKSTAGWLKVVGAAVAAMGILAVGDPFSAMLASPNDISFWLEDLITALALMVGGGAMLCSGMSMDRGLRRFAKYLAVLGDRGAMSVEELARTLGYSPQRVEKDLQKMIDKGYFGGRAFLNVELGRFFRSDKAYEEVKRRQQEEAPEAPEAPEETETGYSGILRNIRRANDRIADPALSAKIDRLEEITARIFKAVEEDPNKRGRIDTFLNYYLPTTQKLLDSYVEFESAGVEGENLRQAKSRIEATMDAIVKGFEHQLDELYQAEVLDVDSDIRVMETMLRRDTASAAEDFGLGGAAVQTAPEEH
ncbi:5-bromo-4-chloroindolyl phosphate hydrolysis family protein [Oscillibacter sp.]|uniref:5-bromo-4-chloroindolyl phosphate hydrolysis family protein n=1 Tax=Oscillibacter sp. TaxID=1945593 RepID=UPI0026370523|nr:5-bromo-4-chloroindolyl phosphate hydrolysis family protein [Oscillibacter sp.]MDD3347011.1 5-bromo-4-chloroindolyl phosphate hydrolysis family protein [Oscillibacter sp.]